MLKENIIFININRKKAKASQRPLVEIVGGSEILAIRKNCV
jgi:hypothetical protein